MIPERRVSESVPRRYRDAEGVMWTVQEWQVPDRPTALYFEADHAFRRVTHYPQDWRDLPTDELEILSHET